MGKAQRSGQACLQTLKKDKQNEFNCMPSPGHKQGCTKALLRLERLHIFALRVNNCITIPLYDARTILPTITLAILVNLCSIFIYFHLQLAHYLQHNFGLPYDENYYNGDWMMGPNYFCWQPFCNIHIQLYSYGFLKTPSSYKELEDTIEMIMKHKTSIDRYRYRFYQSFTIIDDIRTVHKVKIWLLQA